MIPDHDRLSAIFCRVCDMAPELRPAALDRLCGDDNALRTHVESLLVADVSAGTHAQIADIAVKLCHDLEAAETAQLEHSLENYSVLRRIGQGSSGLIFEAWKHNPKRKVAIKVLRPDVATSPAARLRFEIEGEVLATLDHENIAKVLETGTVTLGGTRRPFIAMELVNGKPITEHLAAAAASISERVELLLQACDAMTHAHSRGIIHRDLKPSNLLVDRRGRVRIVDFGIAALAERERRPKLTRTGELLGTLHYMSPEQANQLPTDTRTDVYALGVLAFEILTGTLPYRIDENDFAGSLARITEAHPPSLATYDRRYRGDLNAIVAKALEKNPAERYQSPADLGSDLRLWKAHCPVGARAVTPTVRLARFMRRQPALAAAGGSAVGLLIFTLVTVLVSLAAVSAQRSRAAEGELAARSALAEAQTLNGFLEDLFLELDEHRAGGNALVSDVLDQAVPKVMGLVDSDPLIAARAAMVVGVGYRSLDDFSNAESLLGLACELYEQELAGPDPRHARALNHLGIAFQDQGRLEEAAVTLEEALGVISNTDDASHLPIVIRLGLADIRSIAGQHDASLPLIEEAIVALKQLPDRRDDLYHSALNSLAVCQEQNGLYHKAVLSLTLLIEEIETLFGEHYLTADYARLNLASILLRIGEEQQVEPLLSPVVARLSDSPPGMFARRSSVIL